MSSKSKRVLFSVFTVLVTAIIFLLVNSSIFDTAMCWLAFILVIVSEAILGYFWCTTNGIPQKYGLVLSSLAQTVVNIIGAVIFLSFFIDAIVGFIVFTVISFALLAVLVYFFGQLAAPNTKMKAAKDYFIRCRAVVNAAMNSPAGEKYARELEKLDENLRFCNDGLLVEGDAAIYEAVCALNYAIEQGSDSVLADIQKINGMIKQREFMAQYAPRA